MKRFACEKVIPGCDRVFTGADDQSVLDQVLEHVAAVHVLVEPSLPFIELVMTHTHPVFPARHRRQSWVVGAGSRTATGFSTSEPPLDLPGKAPVTNRPGWVNTSPADHRGNSNGRSLRSPALGSGRPVAHRTYRHECVMYAGTCGFLDAVVPFVRDGLVRQEPVMAAVAEPRLGALRSALGDDAQRVVLVDMADLGRNPALIIPAWREFINRYSGTGRPVRGVGEPIWVTRTAEEIVEAQLHEALLNIAVSSIVPLWLLCPYDATVLDEPVLAEAHRSHPMIVEADIYRRSTQYGGTAHVAELFGAALPDPGVPTSIIAFDPGEPSHVGRILRAAVTAGLPVARTLTLTAAVVEVARAGYQDAGHVAIRLWHDRATVICEITDPGRVDDPMIGRRVGITALSPRERAVRLANELCDLVQVRSGSTGTTTRVHLRVTRSAPAGSDA